ncbi:glucosidase II beta subunit-like-domain-containing protein [Polychytrium aggregatum]|uniref:glucosidase II beta subunit-like-domain-containing protein n=1 Tax=Polychytrium aggregatum TaxID=110093 RepID=UPI0022FDDB37|nr:glucosidase II beta subunit-like-domain-containing protein [Polychytrium aggregatum]KAI9204913.1 glucosidase II beta subunit-like-domain-containing protein [Polychytrium aggregatum]
MLTTRSLFATASLTAVQLLSLTSPSTAASAIDSLYGVSPEQQSSYVDSGSGLFQCLDGSKSIAFSLVNDDYCDCPDGSDEPGTSACDGGHFYCRNEGHIGVTLSSSRVNDGVCDCCDGSDEWGQIIKCTNSCKELQAQLKKKQAEENKVRQKAAKLREQYVREAQTIQKQRKVDLANYEAELQSLTARIDVLKNLKENADAFEKYNKQVESEVSERQSRRECPSKLSKCEIREGSLRQRILDLEQALHDIQGQLESIEGDEAQTSEGIVKVLERVRSATEAPEVVEEDSSSPEDVAAVDSDDSGASVATEDPCSNPEVGFSACLWHSASVTKQSLVQAVDGTINWQGWAKLLPKRLVSFSEDDRDLARDPSKAQSQLWEVERKRSEVENKIKDVHTRNELDMGGSERIWESLYGKCFSIDSHEYTYELCYLEKVTQKSKNGGSFVNLGKFTRWGGRKPSDTAAGAYSSMMYENGETCWNGPARSVEVKLECGPDNTIVAVTEPSKCEYEMKVQTPVVCGGGDSGHSDRSEL